MAALSALIRYRPEYDEWGSMVVKYPIRDSSGILGSERQNVVVLGNLAVPYLQIIGDIVVFQRVNVTTHSLTIEARRVFLLGNVDLRAQRLQCRCSIVREVDVKEEDALQLKAMGFKTEESRV